MKRFVFGIIIGVMLTASANVFAESATKTIDAVFGQVKLVVNGKAVDKETLLYDGTTYVPLRAAAEVLGMEVNWDGGTNTASLTAAETPIATTPVSTPTPEPKTQPASGKSDASNTPITIDQISYAISVEPPNSIGRIYMTTSFTNNSQYTLSSIQLTYLDKNTNKKQYLSTYDTLLPGDTSSEADTFGPESGNMADMQLLETRIVILKDDDDKVFITYDHKTNRYDVLGSI